MELRWEGGGYTTVYNLTFVPSCNFANHKSDLSINQTQVNLSFLKDATRPSCLKLRPLDSLQRNQEKSRRKIFLPFPLRENDIKFFNNHNQGQFENYFPQLSLSQHNQERGQEETIYIQTYIHTYIYIYVCMYIRGEIKNKGDSFNKKTTIRDSKVFIS